METSIGREEQKLLDVSVKNHCSIRTSDRVKNSTVLAQQNDSAALLFEFYSATVFRQLRFNFKLNSARAESNFLNSLPARLGIDAPLSHCAMVIGDLSVSLSHGAKGRVASRGARRFAESCIKAGVSVVAMVTKHQFDFLFYSLVGYFFLLFIFSRNS